MTLRFEERWLSLREPLDAASRAHALVEALAGQLPRPLHVIDLGAGTGASVRYLAPRLGGAQSWTLIDDDPALLSAVPARMRAPLAWPGCAEAPEVITTADALLLRATGFQCEVRSRRLDLARELDALSLPTGALVSACALLDLVSVPWLRRLAERCREAQAAVCFALSFDGRMQCRPAEPEDARVRELFHRHQSRDKGFGPAMGPAAASEAIRLLEKLGYTVRSARSDWPLGAAHAELQAAALDGWLAAALEVAPPQAAEGLHRWRQRREEHVAAGVSLLRVGHVDLIAWLKNTGVTLCLTDALRSGYAGRSRTGHRRPCRTPGAVAGGSP